MRIRISFAGSRWGIALCALLAAACCGCQTQRQAARHRDFDIPVRPHVIPRPPDAEQLPPGTSVQIVREGQRAPRYVIIDQETGLPTRVGATDWVQYGVSSWYGPGFHGRKTACGETYDQYGMTAAHRTLPLGSWVRVTNLHNNCAAVVRINDRGPYYKERVLDVSRGVARELDMEEDGLAWVRIELLHNPPGTAAEAP